MKMKKGVFFTDLRECMEMDKVELTEDTVFADLPDYDSLAAMSIISFVDERFGETITGEELRDMKTVRDLMVLIGLNCFEQ
jgi:acyl carrier protein